MPQNPIVIFKAMDRQEFTETWQYLPCFAYPAMQEAKKALILDLIQGNLGISQGRTDLFIASHMGVSEN